MECRKCGTTVNDGDLYCLQCGARLDGKKECQFCGKEINENAVFCSFCGKRIDGKMVCKKCGAVYEGNFCAQCGEKSVLKAPKEKSTKTTNGGFKFNKIESYLTPAIALGALFVLFICSFFVGITLKMEGLVESTTTFDFFGKTFDNLNAQLQLIKGDIHPSDFDAAELMLKLPYIIIAVMLGINLAVSTVMIIIASIKLGVGFYNKKEVEINKFLVIAFASFLITSMIVYSAFCSVNITDEIVVSMSSGSLAGLIISGLLILGALVIRRIAVGKQGLNGANICKTVCMFSIAVLVLIVGVLISKNFIASTEVVRGEQISGKVSTTAYLEYGFALIVNSVASVKQMNETMILSIMSHFVYIVALILIGLTICSSLSELFENKTKKGNVEVLIINILTVSFVLVLMVMSIISANSITSIDPTALGTLSTNRTAVIAPTVLTVLALAASIINKSIVNKMQSGLEE